MRGPQLDAQAPPSIDSSHWGVFILSMPVLAEQLLHFFVSFFDTYLSGRLGATATSAVGISAYMSWMASMLAGLVGVGTSALVARAWGASQRDEAEQIATQALMLAAGLGLLICGLLQALASIMPAFLGMDAETRIVAERYLRIDAIGQIFAAFTFAGSAALRGTGDMRTPLLVLGLTNVVNVIASVGLVYGTGPFPRLGIDGIVIGTVIAQGTGAILMGVAMTSGWLHLTVKFSNMKWRGDLVRRILHVGAPAALDGLVTFIGHFAFLMVISRLAGGGFSGPIFAAHIVGVRVESISYLPSVAWGIASASLTGRLLGAGQIAEAGRVAPRALTQSLGWAVFCTFVFYFFAPQIYAAMHTDPEVALAGIPAFQLMAAYQIPNAFLLVFVATLRGAGDTRFPLYAAILGVLCLRVPVAYLCGVVYGAGLWGAWLGMGADNTCRAALVIWRYRSRQWAKLKV